MNSFAGTSIQDLQRTEKQEQFDDLRRLNDIQLSKFGAMQNQQHEIGHDVEYNNHQAQQIPYYDMADVKDYPNWLPKPPQEVGPRARPPQRQQQQHPEPDIEDLALDISNSLPTDTVNISVNDMREDFEDNKSGGYLSFIPEILREPLIILVLFILLSEAFVQENIGKYIPQVNPCSEGKVSRVGVVIYGLVLVILYMILKKLLL
jgi:hypothetical protein